MNNFEAPLPHSSESAPEGKGSKKKKDKKKNRYTGLINIDQDQKPDAAKQEQKADSSRQMLGNLLVKKDEEPKPLFKKPEKESDAKRAETEVVTEKKAPETEAEKALRASSEEDANKAEPDTERETDTSDTHGSTELHQAEKEESEPADDEVAGKIERVDQTRSKETVVAERLYGGETIEAFEGVIFSRDAAAEQPATDRHASAEATAQPHGSEMSGERLPQVQPEQRVVATDSEVIEPEVVPAATVPEIMNRGGNQPPEIPPEVLASGESPDPEHEIYGANALPNPVVPSANVLTQKDLDEAEYYGRKAGIAQGVLTGAVVAGAYEHFKHKRREKRTQKRFNEQSKQLKKTNESQTFDLAEQAKQNADLNRRLAATERHTAYTEKRFNSVTNNPAAEKSVRPGETDNKRTAEQQRIAHELRNNPPELLEVPQDHRLEQSAWHTIEVDAKTGKPVERPTFEYGQEYHRERAQETRAAASKDDAAKQAAATALGSAIAGSTISSDLDDNKRSEGSRSGPPSATTQGPPTAKLKAKAKAGLDSLSKQAASAGPIWPMAAALVVLIILILILL
jgi:hypothetical protein